LSVFHVHVIWFLVFSLLTLLSIAVTLFVSFNNCSLFFSFNIFSTWLLDIKVSFFLDWISSSFMTIVLFISTIIIIYSYNYMAPYSKSSVFLWLTVLFVTSIVLVITIPNLFFVMLGWDGLGLISFFLIVYYQNQSSITSGLFTLIINRLGDRFFLIRITFFFYYYTDFTYFSSNLLSTFSILILVLTFITKSALYPFSPWLPLAIAAPTPISALVHSSTLVTSGLFLMIRYSHLLYSEFYVIQLLICVSIFTSFYAGLNTIFEIDIKKLIALSTLRHLGFIGMSFSVGLLHLSFFHLLVHALFKSLLFITIGDIIINLNHSQDIRYLSKGRLYTPFSSLIINISILNLLGMPNLSGYFSKDLVLESLNYTNISFFLLFITFLNIIFTYNYSYKLFFYSFQSIKLNPYQLFHSISFLHAFLMIVLSISTLVFAIFYINYLFQYIIFYSVINCLKFLPVFLNFLIFTYLYTYLVLPTVKSKYVFSFFSSILFLRNLAITFISQFYYSFLFKRVKSIEIGFLNFRINKQFLIRFNLLSSFIFKSLRKIHLISLSFTTFFLFFYLISFTL